LNIIIKKEKIPKAIKGIILEVYYIILVIVLGLLPLLLLLIESSSLSLSLSFIIGGRRFYNILIRL